MIIKPKILLIGNGPSALKYKRGQEIDDFEGKIARFNHYKIYPYEDFIGTRTDILVLGQLDVENQLSKDYDCILLYQARLDGGAGLRKIKKLSPHNEIRFFSIHEKEKIKFLLEMPRKIEPTTGLIAMYYFGELNNFDLYIHGFDFTDTDYFSNISNIDSHKNHDLEKEAVYIEYLIEKGLMKRF